jgi:hypothetical protein
MTRYLSRLKAIVGTSVAEMRPPTELTELPKAPCVSFVSTSGAHNSVIFADEDEAMQIAERAALAADRVPAVYLELWATFQSRRPLLASVVQWQQAMDDAGNFLDQWGRLAAQFDWPPDDLFGHDGLAFFLMAERVRALAPGQATTESGRLFMARGR